FAHGSGRRGLHEGTMTDGFLGFQASFMLDVVVCALLLVVPALVVSIYLVKVRRNYVWHRNIQLALGVVLLVAVTAFEVDLHLVLDGWESIVACRQPALDSEQFAQVTRVLRIHLIFAISTPLLWIAATVLALRNFPSPPTPGRHSRLHWWLGWLS